MGNFLAVTAFRNVGVQEVARDVIEYAGLYGVSCDTLPGANVEVGAQDAQVFAPVNGWTVVLWPPYFNIFDFPLARHVARAKSRLISSVHVYDGDYWEHLAVSGPEELHCFCSRPNYWEDDPAELKRVASYRSAPDALAAAAGSDVAALRPYLVDVDRLEDDEAKAHDDDESELADEWVFTDFWKRLGIAYPDPRGEQALVLRFSKSFDRKLPTA